MTKMKFKIWKIKENTEGVLCRFKNNPTANIASLPRLVSCFRRLEYCANPSTADKNVRFHRPLLLLQEYRLHNMLRL